MTDFVKIIDTVTSDKPGVDEYLYHLKHVVPAVTDPAQFSGVLFSLLVLVNNLADRLGQQHAAIRLIVTNLHKHGIGVSQTMADNDITIPDKVN